MPLYVYACPSCEIVVEERRAVEMADFPPVECPVCHGLCEREIALVNIVRAGVIGRDSVEQDDGSSAPLLHPPSCACCGGLRAR
jgi:putative FmdB family regulatory protein